MCVNTHPDVVILVGKPFHCLISALVMMFRAVLHNVWIFVVLRLEEIVQDFFVVPSVVPHRSPSIIVVFVAPYVYHVVDGTGPSHNLHTVTI